MRAAQDRRPHARPSRPPLPSRPHRRPRPGARAGALLTAGLLLGLLPSAPGGPGAAAQATERQDRVRVNQVGYLTGAGKVAVVVSSSRKPLDWRLRSLPPLEDEAGGDRAGGDRARSGKNPSGKASGIRAANDGRTGSRTASPPRRTVASGRTTVHGPDRASGERLHHADFSRVRATGRYVLEVEGAGSSVPFSVRDRALYPELGRQAMEYFYFHRLGTDIEPEHLQHPAHAHAALHPGDDSVPCYRDWCGKGERLDVRGAWADAGDFGIYPVNHAFAAWTLLNLHERDPRAFPDGSLAIPESDNGRPDLLDETEYGSRFLPGMLPRTGLASHKVHNHEWSGFPPKSVAEENAMARSAMPPSTNATYAVARTTAQLARVLAPYDEERAASLWRTAEDAWSRAAASPDTDYTARTADAEGGGDYEDRTNSDDRYAAAAELYLTGLERDDSSAPGYRAEVTRSRHYGEVDRRFFWADTATTGTLSLLTAGDDRSGDDVPGDDASGDDLPRDGLPASDLRRMEKRLLKEADRSLATLGREGYPVPLAGHRRYPWGSNSAVVNRMLLLGTAYDTTGDEKYLRGAHRSMDYLMGNNAMRLGYVTGYGERSETDLHDRLAWGAYPKTPYPAGWLSGGPNNTLINDTATPKGRPAAKSYAGKGTAPAAWGSKENTVNWNAPLVWVAAFLDRTARELTPPS